MRRPRRGSAARCPYLVAGDGVKMHPSQAVWSFHPCPHPAVPLSQPLNNEDVPHSFPSPRSLLLLAAGCGQKKPAAGPAPGHPLPNPRVDNCEPGKPGGVFTIVTPGAPQRFNPMLAADAASDEVVRLLFSSLVTMDETTQTPGPGLAESWSVSPDGKTWTFKLRAGLHWSDGEPLTVDDVVFTWNNVMYDRDLNRMSYGVFIAGGRRFEVSKVDEVTVRVQTAEVFAPFLEFFGQVDILPKHKMEIPARQHNFLSVYTINTPPATHRRQRAVSRQKRPAGPIRVAGTQSRVLVGGPGRVNASPTLTR